MKSLSNMNQVELLPWIRELKIETNTLLHQEELSWRQRSRSIWSQARDKNTKYFHYRASHKRRKNHISGINNSNGVWCTAEDHIAEVAEKYFEDLFHSTNPTTLEEVLDLVE